MSAKYVVNGHEYDRIEDMPPEVRSMYQSLSGLLADTDHNGIPDIMEGKGVGLNISASSLPVNIVHDGKVYASASDLPPELRTKYDKAIQEWGGSAVGASGALPANTVNLFTTGAAAHILHDGKLFTDPSHLPPEARERYEKAMKLLGDANQNGIPDILESVALLQTTGSLSAPSGPPAANLSAAPSTSQPPGPLSSPSGTQANTQSVTSTAQSSPPSAGPSEGGGRNMMVAALLMLLLAAVVVIAAIIVVQSH